MFYIHKYAMCDEIICTSISYILIFSLSLKDWGFHIVNEKK